MQGSVYLSKVFSAQTPLCLLLYNNAAILPKVFSGQTPLCLLLYNNAAFLPMHVLPNLVAQHFLTFDVAVWYPCLVTIFSGLRAQAAIAAFNPPELLVDGTKASTQFLRFFDVACHLIGPCPSVPMLPVLCACVCMYSSSCLMLQYMQYHGIECEILPLPTCEPNKSFNLIFQVAERLEAFKLNRYISLPCNAQTSLC